MTVQQKSYKVLVIGDTCYDRYYLCCNTRLNPESSAPLVQISSTYYKEGMGGNVAYGLEQLGLKVKTILSREPGTKTRYINAVTKEQLLRVDFDPKVDPLTVEEIDNIAWHLYDAVVLADYDKGFLSYEVINHIAKSFSGPVFLDTKKKELDKLNTRIYLKINEHEANAATVVPKHTIVTMGAYGALWYDARWPAYRSETVDVCGAGDAFMAGLVYGYLNDSLSMIELGIVNAGISVRHIGTYSPSLEELKQGFDEYIRFKKAPY